jgi:hypothetical protein
MTQPASAGTIRPFRADDAPAVAALFMAMMRGTDTAPSDALVAYFRQHYLEGPFADPDCPALVHVDADDLVDGFGGRVAQPFTYGERTLRMAIVGTLMVRDHKKSPMAGARLLKALMAGPQDLTFSETAGDASLAMWRQLRGTVLDRHSLSFIRVLKPVRFALGLAAARIGAMRLLNPLAALPDRLLAGKPGPLRWTGLPADFRPERGLHAEATTPETFAELFRKWADKQAAAPVWPGDCLPEIVAIAMRKPAFGEALLRVALTDAGVPAGAYLFHLAGDGAAQVTDLVHAPGAAGAVLDCLFADAAALGASSVRGRTTPVLLDALLSRRTIFVQEGASVIAGTDTELIELFASGRVFLNGFVGERWTRFVGDDFAAGLVKPNARLHAGEAATSPKMSMIRDGGV